MPIAGLFNSKRKEFVAETEDAGKRLDQFLVERLQTESRARVQQLLEAGRVRMNGAPVKAGYRLRGGETVGVDWQARPPLRAYPEDLPLDIVYEDDDIAVVNKAAGMTVHAGAGRDAGTLVNALLHRFGRLSGAGGGLRPGIVQRLDRQTSGLLVAAKNDQAHRALAAQFQQRTVEKTYLALVHGAVKEERGKVSAPIARDLQRRHRMTARRRGGREAVSEYRVLRRLSLGAAAHGFAKNEATLLEVTIHTGRTHQIRVHLSGEGHPVVGDTLYGAPGGVLDRNFLHAARLAFDHPRTGERRQFSAPLPPELETFLAGKEPLHEPA